MLGSSVNWIQPDFHKNSLVQTVLTAGEGLEENECEQHTHTHTHIKTRTLPLLLHVKNKNRSEFYLDLVTL